MNLRRGIIPKSAGDKGACAFICAMIPMTYWFELFVVIPSMYSVWSIWYAVHFICGTFLMVNITSNFVALMVVDTSICGRMLPSTLKPKWHFCAVCESVVPPRTWHCNVCDTCILKREHHCIFAGCCVGHYNYRYFYVFLLYMFVATVYATYFNVFFLWHTFKYHSIYSLVKILFPMAMFVFGFDVSACQFHTLMTVINFAGVFFTGTLLQYHAYLLKHGYVTYERNHRIRDYDLGVTQNIKEVFGDRWYLTWLCPFIKSPLPHDGIEWDTTESWKIDGPKQR